MSRKVRFASLACGLAAFLGAPSFGNAPATPTYSLHTLELVPQFGDDGEVRGAGRGRVQVKTFDFVEFDSAGRIVVAATARVGGLPDGMSRLDRPAVLRFLPDGRPDRTFHGGMTVLPVRGYPDGLAIDSKGRIVVAGSFRSLREPPRFGPPSFAAVRLTPDGRRDGRFGRSGLAGTHRGSPISDVIGVKTSPVDDAVVILYENYFLDPMTSVVRLTSRGRLDASFGTSGVSHMPTLLRGLAIDSHGGVLVGPVRLDARGSPDPAFAAGGSLAGLALDASIDFDGQDRIVALDWSAESGSVLSRFLADGTPDASFGTGGRTPMRLAIPAPSGDVGAAGGIAVAKGAVDRYAFATEFIVSTDPGAGGYVLQAVDPASPGHLLSHVENPLQTLPDTSVHIADVAVAADGASAVGAGFRTMGLSSTPEDVPILVRVSLTPVAEVPLPNGSLSWESEPVVGVEQSPGSIVHVTIPSAPLRVASTGAVAFPASTLSIWLSADDRLDPSDRVVADTSVTALLPGDSISLTTVQTYEVYDPGFTGISGKRLIAVLYAGDSSLESDACDNVAVSGPLP